MRNIFKGGPLDGNVLMTDILTDGGEFVTHLPIEEYDGSNPPVQGIDGQYQREWNWTGIGSLDFSDTESNSPTVGSENSTANDESNTAQTIVSDSTVNAQSDSTVNAQSNLSLRERRESIKLSRGPLAERAGLTVSAVARIETKGHKTQDELDAYTVALEHYENAS